jgi:hypothetical protein
MASFIGLNYEKKAVGHEAHEESSNSKAMSDVLHLF